MDLSNFYEVLREIRKANYNMGVTLDNLKNSVSEYREEHGSDCNVDYMDEVVEKTALEMLLLIRRDKEHKAYDKSTELWNKYSSIPEENRDDKADASEAYYNADDEASDFSDEAEEVRQYIINRDFYNFVD